ncbi:MAG TPA: VOC family protein [Mycobacteriales bacterium]
MSTKIFVNLPVRDLQKSVHFFTELGYGFNAQFTDEHATSMVVSDDIIVMLLDEGRFSDFITEQICDTATHTEVILGLSAGSRAEVDDMVGKALAAGAQPAGEPMDHGFMYGRSFQDLDGHLWEFVWMDPAAIES